MEQTLELLPWPRRVTPSSGVLAARTFDVQFANVRTPRLERAVTHLLGTTPSIGDRSATLMIDCARASSAFPPFGADESYRLDVKASAVTLHAAEEWGVLHGLTTLAQLVGTPDGAPCVSIDDVPRFKWRGLLLDVARHFIPLPALLRTLDGMAAAKLNVLHLHLTDDQAFRFPSIAFPELPAIGSNGVFYGREDLQSLIEHAAQLGIRVVPEIDVPGHCTSWLAAHPEWGAKRRRLAPSDHFGVHEACLDPSSDDVHRALEVLFAEVADVFPDEYVHIGGDEVHPKWWRDSTRVVQWMEREALSDVAAAQAAFSARVAKTLERLGRKTVGWDEVLHERLPEATLVQSWRGAITRDRTLAAGYDCLFSAGYYLDLFYPADVHYSFDPEASPEALAAAEARLLDDPRLVHVHDALLWARRFAERGHVPSTRGDKRGRVVGGEACLWSELVNEEVLDARLWSRLPAVAERFWSPASVADNADMARRLEAFQRRLPALAGIDLDARVRGGFAARGVDAAAFAALRPLFDALEPAKWYTRLLGKESLAARVRGQPAPARRPYRVRTRLDRVADLLPPESAAARALGFESARGGVSDGGLSRERIVALADGWRAQRASFAKLAKRHRALRELEPLSEALAALADVIEGRVSAAEAQLRLARAKEPMADLVIAIVPIVEATLRARSG